MSRLTPCKRRDFVRRLRILGFEGPYSGTRHQFMTLATHRLAIPSYDEYPLALLQRMLGEVEALIGRRLDADEWNSL